LLAFCPDTQQNTREKKSFHILIQNGGPLKYLKCPPLFLFQSKSTSSVPPLASSTPEKLVHHSFTSTSPIHTSNTIKPSSSSPQSNLTAGVKPRKHIFTSPLKTGPSPLKTGPSPLKSTSSNIGGGIPRNHSFSSSSPLKTGPSPLKTTSANVEGAKQRSSSLSRLRPPSAVGSKVRFKIDFLLSLSYRKESNVFLYVRAALLLFFRFFPCSDRIGVFRQTLNQPWADICFWLQKIYEWMPSVLNHGYFFSKGNFRLASSDDLISVMI
jgi:hypothetical protein